VIQPSGYYLDCDDESCVAAMSAQFMRDARKAGWQIGVKQNGERAQRGGKDYCPRHLRGGVG
jgi:hypothetical protein